MSGATGIAWGTIMPAIQQWVMFGTGLDANHVVWALQPGAPRPSGPFASLRLMDIGIYGLDWAERDPNPNPTPGAEVIQHWRGPRVAHLEITVFAGHGGTGIGALGPLAMVDGVLTAARTESIAALLTSAGVGVATWEPARSIGSVVNAIEFEPRAWATITLNLASDFAETSTYIESVTMTDDIAKPPETITSTAE